MKRKGRGPKGEGRGPKGEGREPKGGGREPKGAGKKGGAIGILALGVVLAGVLSAIGLRGSRPAPSGLVGQRPAPLELAVVSATPTPTVLRATLPEPAAKGRTLIHFWGPSCPPCVREAPRIQQLHEATARTGLPVVTVSADDTDDIRAFLRAHGHTYRVLHDPNGAAHKAWQVTALPSSFLIDAEGTVLAGGSGPIGRVLPGLRELLPERR